MRENKTSSIRTNPTLQVVPVSDWMNCFIFWDLKNSKYCKKKKQVQNRFKTNDFCKNYNIGRFSYPDAQVNINCWRLRVCLGKNKYAHVPRSQPTEIILDCIPLQWKVPSVKCHRVIPKWFVPAAWIPQKTRGTTSHADMYSLYASVGFLDLHFWLSANSVRTKAIKKHFE